MRFNKFDLIFVLAFSFLVIKSTMDNDRLSRSIAEIRKCMIEKQNHHDLLFDALDVPEYFVYKVDPSMAVDLSNRHEFVKLGYKMKKYLPAYQRELWVKIPNQRNEHLIPAHHVVDDKNNMLSQLQQSRIRPMQWLKKLVQNR